MTLSTRAMFSLLRDGQRSKLLELDPIGSEALQMAQMQTSKGILEKTLNLIKRRPLSRLEERTPKNVVAPGVEQTLQAFEVYLNIPSIFKSIPPICAPNKDLP